MWKPLFAGFALAFAIALVPDTAGAQTRNRTESVTESLLHSAAAANDTGAIRTLLAQGADVNARDRYGHTALLIATHRNAVSAARALIQAGADVNLKDRIDDSPFLYAAAHGYLDILQMALENGADVLSTNRFGSTALIPAAEHGHVEAVHMLLDARVPPDYVNKVGWTALIEAIVRGNGGPRYRQVVEMLIKGNADVNQADHNGATPLQLARERGYADLVAVLTAAGAR